MTTINRKYQLAQEYPTTWFFNQSIFIDTDKNAEKNNSLEGSIVINGGLGVSKNLYVGGNIINDDNNSNNRTTIFNGDVKINNIRYPTTGGDLYDILITNGSGQLSYYSVEGEHVNKASSSTDNAIVRWNGTSGLDVKNTGVILDDSNNITGINSLSCSTITTTSSNFTTLNATTLNSGNIQITGNTINESANPLTLSANNTSVKFANTLNLANHHINNGSNDITFNNNVSINSNLTVNDCIINNLNLSSTNTVGKIIHGSISIPVPSPASRTTSVAFSFPNSFPNTNYQILGSPVSTLLESDANFDVCNIMFQNLTESGGTCYVYNRTKNLADTTLRVAYVAFST